MAVAAKEWLMDLSLTELVDAIQSQKATPLESLQACFARVHRLNPSLNALVYLREHGALREAQEQTLKIARGSPLFHRFSFSFLFFPFFLFFSFLFFSFCTLLQDPEGKFDEKRYTICVSEVEM